MNKVETKRILTVVLLFLLLHVTAFAAPSRRGFWQTLTLADGTTVKAEKRGDEHCHWWQTADGQRYVSDGDAYVVMTSQQMARRQNRRERTALRRTRRLLSTRQTAAQPTKRRGLMLLANFFDVKFADGHDQSLYDRIANESGFTSDEGFRGSVGDYYRKVSRGLFDIHFDVVGPVSLSKNYAYYGKNDYNGDDLRAGEMVREALQLAKDQINLADYDWDGDGEVEQVVVVYAGPGEYADGNANTIWPHEFTLSESDEQKPYVCDGITVDTYAVCNELIRGTLEGIGTFCHEFAHCLGLPDMYDVGYGGNYGMGKWSLMDEGSSNGDGFVPCALTSYERMACGWLTPVELTQDTRVDGMLSLEEGGNAYLLRNNAQPDEYLLMENRQLAGWDKELPGTGLLVLHVDYDEDVWAWNMVNCFGTYYDAEEQPHKNDHQRCTILHADNSDINESGDPYPYGSANTVSASSVPACSWYDTTLSGDDQLGFAITGIARQQGGRIGFSVAFTHGYSPQHPSDGEEGVFFAEHFSECDGTGGNDQLWSGTVASSKFVADNEGWTGEKLFAAKGCARMGTSKAHGYIVTPAIQFGAGADCVLSFRAAPWGDDDECFVRVEVEQGTATVSEPDLAFIPTRQWTSYSMPLRGRGEVRLRLIANERRFFLDDVVVASADGPLPTDFVLPHDDTPKTMGNTVVRDLQGRPVTTPMRKGIYIIGNRKIVKL